MNREFHIVASHFETSFTMKCTGGGDAKEFSSLFAAARHARATAGCEDGFVVISDESGRAMSRIPFNAGR
jgi:hypothetical protein